MATDRLTLAHTPEEAVSHARPPSASRPRSSIKVASKTDLRELEQRLDLRFEKLKRSIDRMLTRLGALAVVRFGLLFGALHLWPPHG